MWRWSGNCNPPESPRQTHWLLLSQAFWFTRTKHRVQRGFSLEWHLRPFRFSSPLTHLSSLFPQNTATADTTGDKKGVRVRTTPCVWNRPSSSSCCYFPVPSTELCCLFCMCFKLMHTDDSELRVCKRTRSLISIQTGRRSGRLHCPGNATAMMVNLDFVSQAFIPFFTPHKSSTHFSCTLSWLLTICTRVLYFIGTAGRLVAH